MSRSPTLVNLKRLAKASNDKTLIEAISWLVQFETRLQQATWAEVHLQNLCCMMVEVPGNCDCDLPFEQNHWKHRNHQTYNRVVRELLDGHKARLAIRRLVKKDVTGPDMTIPGVEYSHPFGHYIRKDYGQQLLDHFLCDVPSPEWVGVT